MKIAYTIAPYRGKTVCEIHRHIQQAEALAAELWRAGFAVVCPHKNSAYFDGIVPDELFLAGDIEILRRCDFAVVTGLVDLSDGCRQEMDFCHANHIPLYTSVAEAVKYELC